MKHSATVEARARQAALMDDILPILQPLGDAIYPSEHLLSNWSAAGKIVAERSKDKVLNFGVTAPLWDTHVAPAIRTLTEDYMLMFHWEALAKAQTSEAERTKLHKCVEGVKSKIALHMLDVLQAPDCGLDKETAGAILKTTMGHVIGVARQLMPTQDISISPLVGKTAPPLTVVKQVVAHAKDADKRVQAVLAEGRLGG